MLFHLVNDCFDFGVVICWEASYILGNYGLDVGVAMSSWLVASGLWYFPECCVGRM